MRDISARELKGHNILAVERFWDNTRWMIEFSVLRPSTACSAWRGCADYLFPAEWCNFAGYGIFDQPDGAAAGCDLAAGQGTEFEICDPGLGVWVNDVNIIWNEKKQDNGI